MLREHLIKFLVVFTGMSFILAYQNCAAPLDEKFLDQMKLDSLEDENEIVGGPLRINYEINGDVKLGIETTLSILAQGGDGIYTYSLTDKNGQLLGNTDKVQITVLDFDAIYTIRVRDKQGQEATTEVDMSTFITNNQKVVFSKGRNYDAIDETKYFSDGAVTEIDFEVLAGNSSVNLSDYELYWQFRNLKYPRSSWADILPRSSQTSVNVVKGLEMKYRPVAVSKNNPEEVFYGPILGVANGSYVVNLPLQQELGAIVYKKLIPAFKKHSCQSSFYVSEMFINESDKNDDHIEVTSLKCSRLVREDTSFVEYKVESSTSNYYYTQTFLSKGVCGQNEAVVGANSFYRERGLAFLVSEPGCVQTVLNPGEFLEVKQERTADFSTSTKVFCENGQVLTSLEKVRDKKELKYKCSSLRN